jgi:hypothetical protein
MKSARPLVTFPGAAAVVGTLLLLAKLKSLSIYSCPRLTTVRLQHLTALTLLMCLRAAGCNTELLAEDKRAAVAVGRWRGRHYTAAAAAPAGVTNEGGSDVKRCGLDLCSEASQRSD